MQTTLCWILCRHLCCCAVC